MRMLKDQIKQSKFTSIISKVVRSEEEIDVYKCSETLDGLNIIEYNGFYV
jgi:hypothetical protein